MLATCPPFDADCERVAQISAFKWRTAFDYEDAVQDARIGVWKANQSWRASEPMSLRNWRYMKAGREIIDGYRSRHPKSRSAEARSNNPEFREPRSLDKWVVGQADDPNGQSLGDTIAWIETGFDHVDMDLLITGLLGSREAAIIRASFFEGVLCKEIGAQLGMTESRVVQIRKNALGVLREALSEGACPNRYGVPRSLMDRPAIFAQRSA